MQARADETDEMEKKGEVALAFDAPPGGKLQTYNGWGCRYGYM